MPIFEIGITELNYGVAEIEADSYEEALNKLYDDFDYVHWVDSEIVNIEMISDPV